VPGRPFPKRFLLTAKLAQRLTPHGTRLSLRRSHWHRKEDRQT